MKKLFFALLMSVMTVSVFANDEAQIRDVFTQSCRLVEQLKFNELLAFYAADYSAVDAEGLKFDAGKLKKIAEFINIVKNPQQINEKNIGDIVAVMAFLDPDDEAVQAMMIFVKAVKKANTPGVKFSQVMEVLGATPEEIKQLKTQDNTPEARAQLQNILNDFSAFVKSFRNELSNGKNKLLEEMQKYAKDCVASFRIISVKVSGDNAVVVYQETDLEKKKVEETTCEMVKQSGKWLIRREVGRYL